MLVVVNGYFCYDSCQVAAARAGRDPHKPAGQSDGKHKAHGLADPASTSDGPGGTDGDKQKDIANAVDPAADAGASNSDYQSSQAVNLLV